MPTQRDDAAYKQAYRQTKKDGAVLRAPTIGRIIHYMHGDTLPGHSEGWEARVDAFTDILMERGLCSSVLNWHARPARAADDLEF